MNKDIELLQVIGENVDRNHPSWNLIFDIQHGLRNSITIDGDSNNSTKPTNPNEIKMFYSTGKAQFFKHPVDDNFKDQLSFKFKIYQPNAFKYLRKLFNISIEEFKSSFCSQENPLRELSSPGKSGSFFYFSNNMKYIIKTISKDESKLLRKILPQYIQHIEDNPLTLLPRFYGMFRVEGVHHSNKIRFIIIDNLFPANKKISLRFDLKGSHQDRETKNKPNNLDNITYKDIDFLNDNLKIKIENQDTKNQFINQIKKDSKFLKSLNIMDYSLLVGIHYCNNNSIEEPIIESGSSNSGSTDQIKLSEIKSKILINSSLLQLSSSQSSSISTSIENNFVEKEIIYYIGIIDILVLYNFKKKFAHFYKTIKYGTKSEISTIAPQKYYKRFKRFIIGLIE
ncbi:hypothetical protein DICPUDRAFT_82999 [Dictyostelium purpureum]|uniref:PIPK domain-containing protein n=1 Tax=Dictyostelium purpureum TaxID=5786 RepID=F0ZY90_DICPU|nr:uncharacterized protein DICPUDRAFT_82999 [Dictyostelium purpureum]EGC31083.1 hypothetical protein DICPUDRAFT_82999 [Dictyostelium purpureum]|eukprot:XP_003292384.1 hypothetical protein DICPUDRAFT_82999 [Dictyostelium purpureum]